ncbi:MAG: HlyC/CorC family transporter [Anaerolineaceae bacterium]|nr:HlyC/CorC family transporter [Anaerolineaceae bacterium]
MSTSIIYEVIIILGLLILNGLFAMSEIAVISSREARIESMRQAGDKRAAVVMALKKDPNRFLSTVQIGITLIGILAGAFGGATLADELARILGFLNLSHSLIETLSVAIVVMGITYFSLVIGELAPKRLALTNPERLALIVARPMRLLSRITSPLVVILSASSDLVVRMFGKQDENGHSITKDEVRIMIEQGTELGVFDQSEEKMVEQVFRLDDLQINNLITPRTDITFLEKDDSPEVIRQKVLNSPHTRMPVAQENLDNILGVVNVNSILSQCLEDDQVNYKEIMSPPIYVPESSTVFQVLDLFKENHSQIAFVIDEFGGLEGLVTGDDILEALVGEIQETDENAEPQVVKRTDGSWLIDGLYQFVDMKERFGIQQAPDVEGRYYQTLGGFVISFLGKIPSAGDHFEWSNYLFEVMDMDGRRVDKILLKSLDQ